MASYVIHVFGPDHDHAEPGISEIGTITAHNLDVAKRALGRVEDDFPEALYAQLVEEVPIDGWARDPE